MLMIWLWVYAACAVCRLLYTWCWEPYWAMVAKFPKAQIPSVLSRDVADAIAWPLTAAADLLSVLLSDGDSEC